jgi:hypothetical protein
MPHGGDKAIWSILVDSTWYGMNRECQHDDTAQAIEKLATEWLEHDYPDVARE